MSHAALLVLFASLPVAPSTIVHRQSSEVVCSAGENAHAWPEEARPRDSPSGIGKESDQNVLIQGKLQVLKSEEADTNGGSGPALYEAKLPEDPVIFDKFALGPGVPFEKMIGNSVLPLATFGAPQKGWFLVPAMGSLFLLLMQCTDIHPDSYSMEEDEKEDATRPPQRVDRLHLFDLARFGLLVGVIWTQLLLAFGNDIIASTLHKFVWPAWFFLAGIFGSSLAYESVSRVICYSLATNVLLICIGFLFSFFNYSTSNSLALFDFCGGAWVLWCLLIYRLTISPLFHIVRALRAPGVEIVRAPCAALLLILIHFGSYACRRNMPPTDVIVDVQPHQVEHVLLMAKSLDATLHAAVLNAPYFAVGLMLSPTHWNSLLTSVWFRCVAVANGMVWFMLTGTPLLCSLGHWSCPEKPWGVKFLIHADSLSGFWEDAACYVTRLSIVLVILCLFFYVASLLQLWAPKLASHLGACGSRIRYTMALFVLWYMIRPCFLSPPQLPFHRPHGMSDLAMGCPALFLALVLTSTGTCQLFRWIVEPYWAKCCIEGCCRRLADSRERKSAIHSAQDSCAKQQQPFHAP